MLQLAKLFHRGGGGNPLTSDDDNSYPQENDDKDDENNTENEEITYIYKTYYDYFVDNMDCTGVYDTDGNLTNVTISDEKKTEILATDFTGSGTSTDPYQVNSSLGFWFMSKFVTLTNCYVELNCDVILNDETFDENGNASGGDGVVYEWKPIYNNAGSATLDGDNHFVLGLYINDAESSLQGLFYTINCINNLSIKNIYIHAKERASAFAYFVYDSLTNCKSLNGNIIVDNANAEGFTQHAKTIENCINYVNIKGNNSIFGISSDADSIVNCENYGKITGKAYVGGIVYDNVNSITNCRNYGKISGTDYVAGIMSSFLHDKLRVIIDGCENYGNISGTNYVGGIVGGNYHGNGMILKRCKNYGSVFSDGWSVGGLLGYVQNNTVIIDCLVDCEKISLSQHKSSGALVGQVYTNDNTRTTTLNVINTKVNSTTNFVIGKIHRWSSVKISGGEINRNDENYCSFVYSVNGDLELSDVSIETNLSSNNAFRFVYEKTDLNSNISIKNLLIQTNCVITDFKLYNGTIGSCDVDGIIVVNGTTPYYYYGSNFSGFYISWRTGKFGLRRNDSSFFQSEVTKEKLIAMGATEKTS